MHLPLFLPAPRASMADPSTLTPENAPDGGTHATPLAVPPPAGTDASTALEDATARGLLAPAAGPPADPEAAAAAAALSSAVVPPAQEPLGRAEVRIRPRDSRPAAQPKTLREVLAGRKIRIKKYEELSLDEKLQHDQSRVLNEDRVLQVMADLMSNPPIGLLEFLTWFDQSMGAPCLVCLCP